MFLEYRMITVGEMKYHCSECKRTYKDEVLFGKRCLEAVEVFYDPKDKIFHRQHKEGRRQSFFIQNTKKGFYVREQGVISEYFYDSYEGWYIRSYYNGFKYNYGCEASAKYKQCDWALDANTRNYELAVGTVKV